MGYQVIDDDGKIRDAVGGVFQASRFAAAFALVARVKGDGEVARFGKRFGIDVAGGLFFAAADRVGRR